MNALKALAYIAVILAAIAVGYRAVYPPAPYVSELQKIQDEQIRAYREGR